MKDMIENKMEIVIKELKEIVKLLTVQAALDAADSLLKRSIKSDYGEVLEAHYETAKCLKEVKKILSEMTAPKPPFEPGGIVGRTENVPSGVVNMGVDFGCGSIEHIMKHSHLYRAADMPFESKVHENIAKDIEREKFNSRFRERMAEVKENVQAGRLVEYDDTKKFSHYKHGQEYVNFINACEKIARVIRANGGPGEGSFRLAADNKIYKSLGFKSSTPAFMHHKNEHSDVILEQCEKELRTFFSFKYEV